MAHLVLHEYNIILYMTLWYYNKQAIMKQQTTRFNKEFIAQYKLNVKLITTL